MRRLRACLLGATGVVLLGLALEVAGARPVAAQQPVSLDEVVRTALENTPRMALARADASAARAALRVVGEYPNPALTLGYSESPPRYHVELEQALEYPWVRSPRIDAARASVDASSVRLGIEGARIRHRVVVLYANALTARRMTALSVRQAEDADELVRIAGRRRDAGDASDLDVDLARMSAAQLHSTLLSDSLQMMSTVLELQSSMGLPTDSVRVVPVDALPALLPGRSGGTLGEAAAEAERRAASRALTGRRRGRFPTPSLRAGFERGDPSGSEPGMLPTLGLSIPLPLFHRQGGAVAEARAVEERAVANLAAARREAALAVALAERRRQVAGARLEADRGALDTARLVADRSLEAYREGAYTLTAVLEARRGALEAERRVLEDLSMLRTAEATWVLARTAGVRP